MSWAHSLFLWLCVSVEADSFTSLQRGYLFGRGSSLWFLLIISIGAACSPLAGCASFSLRLRVLVGCSCIFLWCCVGITRERSLLDDLHLLAMTCIAEKDTTDWKGCHIIQIKLQNNKHRSRPPLAKRVDSFVLILLAVYKGRLHDFRSRHSIHLGEVFQPLF